MYSSYRDHSANQLAGFYMRENIVIHGLTLLWRRPLSYRNQSIDLQSKSHDWFLYDTNFSV